MKLMLLDGSSHQLIDAVSMALKERDTARLALTTIAAGIDPFADQLQNWVAGWCDKGLGR
jgi:hypothetical protein